MESQKPKEEKLSPANLEELKKNQEKKLKNLPDENPGKKAEELQTAEAELNQGYERSDRLNKASEKLIKDKGSVSMLELKTLATTKEGREAMRKNFTSGEVAENKNIKVDFGNNSAEWNIGAGDLLPANVREITIKTKDGKILQGKRYPNPENPSPKRVGYYTTSGEYIPIFSGDEVTPSKIANQEEMDAINKKMREAFADNDKFKGKNIAEIEDTMHEDNMKEEEKSTEEALAALKEAGITDLENLKDLDKDKIKNAFVNFSGETIWKIRKFSTQRS